MRITNSDPQSANTRRTWEAQMLARLRLAAENYSYARISSQTGVHAESVRRYLTKGRPSAYFIAAFCQSFGVSPSWILSGEEAANPRQITGTIEPKSRPTTRASRTAS